MTRYEEVGEPCWGACHKAAILVVDANVWTASSRDSWESNPHKKAL